MQGTNFSVMTPPNTPKPPESNESPQKKKQGISLQSLMRRAVSAELSTGGRNIDPRKYDTLNASTI